VRLELAQRAFLIGAYQAAVAGNVAGENRGQPSVHLDFMHMMAPAGLQLLGMIA
jgi:hypothetical protein